MADLIHLNVPLETHNSIQKAHALHLWLTLGLMSSFSHRYTSFLWLFFLKTNIYWLILWIWITFRSWLNREYVFELAHFSLLFCSWPLACLSWDSAKNCRILSEGIAKDIPAVTFRVLIPITSPSYRNTHKSEDTNVNVNSHKHTAHLHAQMSSCHNVMLPTLIIMNARMCLWSRLTFCQQHMFPGS